MAGAETLFLRRYKRQGQYFLEDLGRGVLLQMTRIPGGKFWMGSPEDEPERNNDESPQHEVTVPEFFVGTYPVTQLQWRAVAHLPKIEIDLDPDPASFKGDQRPVESISWYEAVEFCQRVAAKSRRPYRLPSEAEWEYACRAGSTTPFYFGETITPDIANYDGNFTYGRGPKGVYREETTEVGSFGAANDFGLYDMHGNVYEWCTDIYRSGYEGVPTDGSAWIDDERINSESSESEDRDRVLRGGSWVNFPGGCRSACRFYGHPDVRDFSLGFRVCCSPQDSS